MCQPPSTRRSWRGASRLLQQELKPPPAPRIPIVSTVDNRRVADADAVRQNLSVQLTTSVRYSSLIEELAAEQPTLFVEVGPGQTLTKLNRRILSAGADTIASDNPKRAGLEPLLCAQALWECLAADRPAPVGDSTVTPSHVSVSTVSAANVFLPQPRRRSRPGRPRQPLAWRVPPRVLFRLNLPLFRKALRTTVWMTIFPISTQPSAGARKCATLQTISRRQARVVYSVRRR